MVWTAWQYRDVFDSLYSASDEATQRSILQRLDRLLEMGNLAKRPASSPLRDQILELRAKTARLLFFFQPGQRIIFVVGFFKRQDEVPPAEIDKAIAIRRILLEQRESIYGIRNIH